jgi:hypothetical protein
MVIESRSEILHLAQKPACAMILVTHADVSDSIGNQSGTSPHTPASDKDPDMSTQTIPHEYAVNRPVIEPRTKAFLNVLAAAGGPPLEELSVEDHALRWSATVQAAIWQLL